MAGNTCYVILFRLIAGKSGRPFWRLLVALATAAVSKFTVLYLLVVQVICTLVPDLFLGKKLGDQVLLAGGMLKPDKLPLMFSWPQLVTAVCGGVLAIVIVPVLRKAISKDR